MNHHLKTLSQWLPQTGKSLDWEGLDAAFDWVRELRGVPQDPDYHAEGDVWIHTRMVLEALNDLPDYQLLAEEQRAVLFFACLMHDMAKPACTQIGSDGKISSPGHSRRGACMARYHIYHGNPGPLPFAMRENISDLVRYHGLPLWFLEKPDSRAAVLKAAEAVDMKLLALLAEADVRGRTCRDQQELLDRVELFRMYCMEQGVWDGPYPFANHQARWTYFQKPEGGPLYVPYDDFRCEVVLLSGLPGAGKNHWTEGHSGGLPVITLDDIRRELKISHSERQGLVINTAKDRARVHLRRGQSMIWNATNILPDIRKQLIGLFSEYKARVRIVYLEVPEADLHRQNEAREHVVPRSTLDRMMRKWEVPKPWEAPEVEYWVREG